jgi:hypothetical protein
MPNAVLLRARIATMQKDWVQKDWIKVWLFRLYLSEQVERIIGLSGIITLN